MRGCYYIDISWGPYILVIEEKHRIAKQNKLKSTHKHIVMKLMNSKYKDRDPPGKKAREKQALPRQLVDCWVAIATMEGRINGIIISEVKD